MGWETPAVTQTGEHCTIHGIPQLGTNRKHSMGYIKGVLREALGGSFIHSVRLGKTEEDDRNKGYFANMNDEVRTSKSPNSTHQGQLCYSQVDQVCKTLKRELRLARGFDAVGFSQVCICSKDVGMDDKEFIQ
jgi:hypothetical protein